MKCNLKSILIPVLLGGCWGVFTYLIGSLILPKLPFISSLFYPVLFGGIGVIISLTLKSKIPFERALIVGLISGFIYQTLSPIFPFLSSVLVGASLGGGLVVDEGELKNLFNKLISILKGVFLFPVFIYGGGFLASLINAIFLSDFPVWFFWGGWLGLGICLISMPLFKLENAREDFQTLSEVDDFKSEAQEILRELDELGSRHK